MRLKQFVVAAFLVLGALFLCVKANAQGSAWNGTLYGSPSFVTAASGFGQCLSLNGSSQYMTVPGGTTGPMSFAVNANFTMTARIKSTNSASSDNVILWYSTGNAATDIVVGMNGGKLFYNFYYTNHAYGTHTVDDGNWHNIAFVESGGTLTMYVDGSSDATASISYSSGSVSGGVAEIGGSPGGADFTGNIDEVAIYNTGISSSGTINPSAPISNSAANLIAVYHLDGNANNSQASTPAISVSPTTASTAVNETITITGSNLTTPWTTTAPTITTSLGSLSAESVTSSTTVTYTFSPGGTTGTATLTDTSDSGSPTCTITVSTSAATSYTSSESATSGVTGSSVTLTYTGNGSTTATITPSATGVSGAFSPTSINLNNTTGVTVTFTPSTAGTATLSSTNSGSLTNPSNLTYTVTGSTLISITNSDITFSPYNWYVSGSTYAQSPNPGAYLKLGFTGTSIAVNFDVSPETGQSVTSTEYPEIRYAVDNGQPTTAQLSPSTTSILCASGLTSGSHSIVLQYVAGYVFLNFWGPVNVVRVTGFTLDSGASAALPTGWAAPLSKYTLFYGDSVTAGDNTEATFAGGITNAVATQDATVTYVQALAAAIGAEYGVVAYGGSSWDGTAADGVTPGLMTFYNAYDGSHSRLVSSHFSPVPSDIFVNMGHNGSINTGDVQTLLTALRADSSSTTNIWLTVPFTGTNNYSALNAGFTAYQAAYPSDNHVFFVYLGTSVSNYLGGVTSSLSVDGLHPLPALDALIGGQLAQTRQSDLDALTSGSKNRGRTLQ